MGGLGQNEVIHPLYWNGRETTYDGTATPKCNGLLYQTQVRSNVIGDLPNIYDFYGSVYNKQFLSQLNSNSLMSPMLYSTTATDANSTGSPTNNPQNTGLTAQSQAQQAANFILYASGTVAPLSLPNLTKYTLLYNKAKNAKDNLTQIQSQATLATYFTDLRVYAAQSSVGLGNLYYILSKRMPQGMPDKTSGSSPTSQAMTEFTMATWRLYKPDMTPDKQWVNKLDSASPATVQKEMATLLAEINYQLYLNRQQEERLLLTNTMILFKAAKASQPSANFTNEDSSTQ